jgi:hypothetical protein
MHEKLIDTETLEAVLHALKKAKAEIPFLITDEPFLRGINQGYSEGLHRAINIVLELETPGAGGAAANNANP